MKNPLYRPGNDQGSSRSGMCFIDENSFKTQVGMHLRSNGKLISEDLHQQEAGPAAGK